MPNRNRIGTVSSIIVAIVALTFVGLWAQGCNTEQPPSRQVTDLQITAQVKTKLASDVRASSLANIDVNTTNGVVTLAGEVENADVKGRAETVAAAVPGVVKVNNNLQVSSASASATH